MSLFQKIWHALFSWNTCFEIRPFALRITEEFIIWVFTCPVHIVAFLNHTSPFRHPFLISPFCTATSPFHWLLDSGKIIQCFTPNLYTLPHSLPPPDVIWHWSMLKYIESKYNKQVLHCLNLVEISVDFSPCSNLTQFLLMSKL